jgi:hypothetical protein
VLALGELIARPSDVVVHHVSESINRVDANAPDTRLLG